MLRLTEIKLPLDHSDEDLPAAIATKLDIARQELLSVAIFKRSYDARKKDNIRLIYQLDVALDPALEEQLLAKFHKQSFCRPSPDTRPRIMWPPGLEVWSTPRISTSNSSIWVP